MRHVADDGAILHHGNSMHDHHVGCPLLIQRVLFYHGSTHTYMPHAHTSPHMITQMVIYYNSYCSCTHRHPQTLMYSYTHTQTHTRTLTGMNYITVYTYTYTYKHTHLHPQTLLHIHARAHTHTLTGMS